MPTIKIEDFSAGLQTFGSPVKLKGYQTFENVDNLKPGRLEKPLGEANKSGTVTIDYPSSQSRLPKGVGFITYRTEYDNTGTPVQTSTLWYVAFVNVDDSSPRQWKLYRYNTDTSAWDTDNPIIHQGSGGDWTDDGTMAEISFYVYRGILRISDGLFTNTNNASKWYGHIKRDILGQGITYASDPGRFLQPDQAEAVNEWVLEDQEIKAPTVIKHPDVAASNYRAWHYNSTGASILTAANEVGLMIKGMTDESWPELNQGTKNGFIDDVDISLGGTGYSAGTLVFSGGGGDGAAGTYTVSGGVINSITITNKGTGYTSAPTVTPSHAGNGDASLIADMIYNPFNEKDRFAVTFVYDYVHESELSKNDDGDIGISGFDISSSTRAIAIQLGIFTGSSNASFNKRITGINLYWNPVADVEWYKVSSFDISKGISEEPFVTYTQDVSGVNYVRNTGYWLPSFGNPDFAGANRRIGTGGSGTTFAHGGANPTAPFLVVIDPADSHDISTAAALNDPLSYVGYATGAAAGNITFAVSPINAIGQESTDYTGDSLAGFFPPAIAGGDDTTLCSMFFAFDGSKVSTYQSLTGRYATEKVLAMRWKTADVADDGMACCFNVDTVDENEQTVRERSRAYWTPPGRPDEFSILRSRDIGREDGDEGIRVVFYNDMWYFLKQRNTYVFSKDMSHRIKYYPGFGCMALGAAFKTPFGIVAADENQITLFGDKPVELTVGWREDYQGLTFVDPVVGYSSKTNELYFINDTSEDDLVLYKFNFDNKSWRKQTMANNEAMSNFVLGEDFEPLAFFHQTGNTGRVKEFNTGSASTETSKIKKRFDFGDPNRKKRISGVFATYLTDSMNVDTTDAVGDDPLTAAATTLNVTSGGNFSVNKYYKIGSEIVLVTAINVNALTIVRGCGGTVAASHGLGTTIYKGNDDLTVKLYFDGATTAEETLTFGAVEELVNQIIEPTDENNEFKFVDIEAECDGEDLIIEDISPVVEPKGKKLTND